MRRRNDLALDPQPFRDWVNARVAFPTRAPESLGEFAGATGTDRLARELGLEDRELYRWRFENQTLDRLAVEEALEHADVSMAAVYPDLPEWPRIKGSLGPPPGFRSKLTDDQIRVLHRLHTEREMSIRELGRRIYEQAGYRSPDAAVFGIRRGFRRLCLTATWRHPSTLATTAPRRCTETKTNGEPCEAFAEEGSELCWPHANRDLARERIAAANDVRIGAAA